jgi:DNA invertase Pin-like site-specific DNA recombinase
VRGAIGYVRVSTDEQASSGAGLDAQRTAIRAECERRDLPLLEMYEDAGYSARNLDRPALADALKALSDGNASVLMVAKLDRLTRSVHDATGLMRDADRAGWGLVALDVAVDTTTPQGAAMAQVLAVFAELERRLIGQRTRDALAVKRAQGVRLGRPPTMPLTIVDRIVGARLAGEGWSTIARSLDEEGVPTAQGGRRWYPATVRAVALAHEKVA